MCSTRQSWCADGAHRLGRCAHRAKGQFVAFSRMMGAPESPQLRSSTTIDSEGGPGEAERVPDDALTLVLAWSAHEPERVGEIAVLPSMPGASLVLGRGAEPGPESRLRFFRQRPGVLVERPALASPGLSRRQLLVRPVENGAHVARVGRCVLEVNGTACDEADISSGDVIYLRRELLLLCTRRPALIPRSRALPDSVPNAFGEVDQVGLLGESPMIWRLRESVAFVAMTPNHVLVRGESGTGKELVARAIHDVGSSGTRPFVARNAATLPPSLVDAELFGNVKNYPNAGMPERAGLIGEADGGTLFLDEIGELPQEQQAHLLRVLDADGEYQRLGEAKVRRSRFRLIAATNRDPAALKDDFAARFNSRIDVPGLMDRREDVPLLARHLLQRAARASPQLASRFLGRSTDGAAWLRIDPELVEHMLRRPYRTHVRELDALLWRSLAETTGDVLTLPADLRTMRPTSGATEQVLVGVADPSAAEIVAALEEHGWNVPLASRALALSSRFVLNRLMRKHGIRRDG